MLISNASPLDGSVTKKMTVETTRMNGTVVTIRAYRIFHCDSVGTVLMRNFSDISDFCSVKVLPNMLSSALSVLYV